MEDTTVSTWRAVFDKHQATMVNEVSSLLDSEVAAAVASISTAERENAARQVETARRSTAEALNQALRQMRAAPSEAAILQLLAHARAAWTNKAVVRSVAKNQATSV